MLGWMLVFVMMSVTAVVAQGAGFTAATGSGVVFGFLLLVSALARMLRGRA
jgi:hypothetical protein